MSRTVPRAQRSTLRGWLGHRWSVVCRRQVRGRLRDEGGAAAVWTLILTVTAFTALVGLVGGGGELINDRVQAKRVAEQAARAGADALSASAVRSGRDDVDRREALARAHDVLRASGWDGRIRIRGSEVVVTATGTRSPQLLGLLGVNRVHISQSGSADAISTPDG